MMFVRENDDGKSRLQLCKDDDSSKLIDMRWFVSRVLKIIYFLCSCHVGTNTSKAISSRKNRGRI